MYRNICVYAAVVTAILFAALPLQGGSKSEMDSKIAKYAAILGTNRLAKDLSDEKGKVLLGVAAAIEPENKTVLLTQGFLDRERKPDPKSTKVTEAILLKNMVKRADELLTLSREKNAKVGQLSMLYFLAAEAFFPDDRTVIVGIMRLQADGVTADKDELKAIKFDLEDMFDKPRAPAEYKYEKLQKADEWIAETAGRLGTNRLAEDAADALGLTLLHLSCRLRPDDEKGLYAMGIILREMKPKKVKASSTEANLLKVMLKQATKLASRDTDEEKRRALLYYKVAERIDPDNKDIILELTKMKTRGLKGDLNDLLNERPKREGQDDVAGGDPVVENKFTKEQLKRIDINGKSSKRLIRDSKGLIEVTVKAEVENRNSEPLDNVSLELLLITQHPTTKTIFCVRKRELYEELTIGGKKESSKCTLTDIVSRQTSKTSTTYTTKSFEYYSWVGILRDKDGVLIKVETTSGRDKLESIANKMTKMTVNSTFDIKGRVLTKGEE